MSVAPRKAALALAKPLVGLLKDPHDRVRTGAATALGHLGFEKAIDQLVSVANGDASPTVRFAAAEALASPWLRQTGYLARELQSQSTERRSRAAERLGACEDLNALDPLIGALGDSHTVVREAAMGSLLRLGFAPVGYRHTVTDLGYSRWMSYSELADATKLPLNTEPSTVYLSAIQHSDKAIARGAIEALGLLGTEQELSTPLTDAITEQLTASHWAIRQAAAETLQRLGLAPKEDNLLANHLIALSKFDEVEALGSVAIDALSHAINGSPELHTSTSIAALARVGGAEVSDTFGAQLSHASALVREAAAHALLNTTSFHPGLLSALEDSVESVRSRAGQALSCTPKGIKGLMAACTHEAPEVRLAAVDALAFVPSESAKGVANAVIGCLTDQVPAIRKAAVRALGVHAKLQTVGVALTKHLRAEPESDIRIQVVEALAGHTRYEDTLVEALSDSNRALRQAARKALDAQGWRPTGADAQALAALAAENWSALAKLEASALSVLTPILSNHSIDTLDIERRLDAVRTLITMNSAAATRVLERQLDDPSGVVRAEVTRGLSQLSDHADRSIIPALAKLAQHD
jgi:HEAT repeat protein